EGEEPGTRFHGVPGLGCPPCGSARCRPQRKGASIWLAEPVTFLDPLDIHAGFWAYPRRSGRGRGLGSAGGGASRGSRAPRKGAGLAAGGGRGQRGALPPLPGRAAQRGFGQIGHKITTYPFSPRKSGRKGMAQSQGWVRRYAKAFCKGFFVAVPVAVTFLDRVACVARVEGASMQPSLNPGGSQSSDVVLLNHWKVRNFEVQRGDIVSLVLGPGNVEGISKLQHNCICSKGNKATANHHV
uniref:Inner mitochondrial membrane peptidase subunit 2 n=2 Tax=Canis lupus familiaris TaxID=9615 RepID=A0A8P0SZR6_CANLF